MVTTCLCETNTNSTLEARTTDVWPGQLKSHLAVDCEEIPSQTDLKSVKIMLSSGELLIVFIKPDIRLAATTFRGGETAPAPEDN